MRATARNRGLGRVLRDEREALGVSLADLARVTGVPPSNISRIERGLRGAETETWHRLADALGLRYYPARLERREQENDR